MPSTWPELHSGTSFNYYWDVGTLTWIKAVPFSGLVTIQDGGLLSLESTQLALPSRADTFRTRSDTYTTTGNGTAVNATAYPLPLFGLQVKGTGAAATTWDIRLEGSMDNVNFTQILQHTNTIGDGLSQYSGSLFSPSLYFRSRCAGLVLGSATNVVVTILGLR